MPHLMLEYSRNLTGLDAVATLQALNQALAAAGLFEESDIKSRAQAFDDVAIGISAEPRAFAHAKLAILDGRTPEAKRDISRRLLQALHGSVPQHPGVQVQLCAEIVEIERDSYSKAVRHG